MANAINRNTGNLLITRAGVHCSISGGETAECWGMLLKHFTLKDADGLTAACVEWAWVRAMVT